MATKKTPTIFGVEANLKDDGKLPTLRQWLKENKENGLGSTHRVEFIWFPGQFKNYTLQTSSFRAAVSHRSKLYQVLSSGLDEVTKDATAIYITFSDERRGIYTLSPGNEPGEWFFVEDYGIRWDCDDDV